MPIANIQDMLELPIIGVVPEDRRVKQSVLAKDALVHAFPNSRAARAYRKIAARIIGHTNYKEKYGFWDRLFG